MALSKVLSRALKQLAGSPYHSRGETYFRNGKVKRLIDDGAVTAEVAGTRKYQVQLWEEEGELNYDCSCPVGQDGGFCKHCVAVALAYLERDPKSVRSPFEDIRRYLSNLDSSDLVEMVLEACRRDERLYEKLLLKAAERGDVAAAIRSWKQALERATATHDFVSYRDTPNYAAGISDVIEALDDWLADGRAAEVVALAEFAVERVEEAIQSCDDSGGEIGGLLNHLGDLHLRACLAARPDPEKLAERLFRLELNDEWGTFYDIPERYTKALKKRGLTVYQTLAEAEWAKLPPLTSKDGGRYHHSRSNLTRIMESLARRTGDVEVLVAVKAKDLSSAWHYLGIANAYREAGEHDKALAWAERGLTAFPDRPDSRLREFLIEEYLRRRRKQEALALAWEEYTDYPDLESYRKLHAVARRVKVWQEWREKAIERLREAIDAEFAKRRPAYPGAAPDHRRLVDILLWEKDIEGAWQEACAGMRDSGLWLRLAELRGKTHPAEAAAVYRRETARLVGQTNNRAYASAIILVEKVRRLLPKREFAAYLTELRTQYKQKRNFMKLLDKVAA